MEWVRALFNPKCVALVGASPTPGKLGSLFMANLTAADTFRGTVYAVHPKENEILGHRAFPSLTAIPEPVDLAVVVAPASAVPAIIDDCATTGVAVAVVVTGGFAEAGEPGQRLQDAIVQRARAGGVRLVGPNCFGVISTPAGLNASLAIGMPSTGGISLYTQSGAYGMASFSRSREDGIGFSRVISVGNRCDLDESDVLTALGDDDETRVIAMLLESIRDGRRFFEVASRVSSRKPVIVLKTGKGQAGRRAAASHTASLATDSSVTMAALRQAGVHVVDDGLTMLDLAAALDCQSPLRGRRIGIITNSGGTGVELADLCEAYGLEVPEFSASLQTRIRESLPAYGSAANPVDITTEWPRFAAMYGSSMRAMFESDEVDCIVPVLLQRSALMPEVTDAVIEAVADARKAGLMKPVHVCWVAPRDGDMNRRRLLSAGIACHEWPERTAKVVALTQDVRAGACQMMPEEVVRPEVSTSGGWMSSRDVMELLEGAAFPVAKWRIAASRREALDAASALGLPVVLKAEHPDIIHKSESGAVHVGLTSSDEVGRAYDDVVTRLGTSHVLLQQQIEGSVELVIGATRDPVFGPVIMVGLGGIWVEALGDVALRLAPVDESEALAMIGQLKSYSVLRGAKNQKPLDLASLASLLANLSNWVASATWLEEFDANPVIASVEGYVIVDARMRASPLEGVGTVQGSPPDATNRTIQTRKE